jgi:hypothetical protein
MTIIMIRTLPKIMLVLLAFVAGAAIIGGDPVRAQAERLPVAMYHPHMEKTLWWGMTADDAANSYIFYNRPATADGGFYVQFDRTIKRRGQKGGPLIQLAPGTPALAPYERAVFFGIFGPDGRLRRIDFGLPNKTAHPFRSYGDPLVMWRWQNNTVAKSFTEYVWVMGPYQIARAITYTEDGTRSLVRNLSGQVISESAYRREEIVWAALEYAPPGSTVRAAMRDAHSPKIALFGDRPNAEINLEGRVLVENAFVMPDNPRSLQQSSALTTGAAPAPLSSASGGAVVARLARIEDLAWLLENPSAPSSSDCAALTKWLADSAQRPGDRQKFQNLSQFWLQRAGGGGKASEKANSTASAITRLLLENRAYAAQSGVQPGQEVTIALAVAASSCDRP